MKKILLIMATAVVLISTGCEGYRVWDDGLPEMEHVYYIGFYKSNIATDYLSYEVAQNGDARWRYGANSTSGTWQTTEEKWIATIPIQLYSERIRTYDAVNYFWIYNLDGSSLTAGSDYTVTLDGGTELTPGPNGAYSLTWSETKKGVQNIKIKRAATSPKGALRVNLYNPADGMPVITDLSTTIQNKTAEFEIRCMTQDNNRVTVTFTD